MDIHADMPGALRSGGLKTGRYFGSRAFCAQRIDEVLKTGK